MATRTHEKSACPYCSWNSRTHKLPAHLVGQHLEHVTLKTGLATEHSIDAFVTHGNKRLEFAVCLTCGAGVVDNTTTYTVRWRNHHCTKKDCIKAHPEAYRVLKERLQRLTEERATSQPNPILASHVTWASCKSYNGTLGSLCARIEVECKSDFADDSDNEGEFVFNPMDGFARIAKENAGYSARLEKTRKQLQDATARLRELEKQVELLTSENKST